MLTPQIVFSTGGQLKTISFGNYKTVIYTFSLSLKKASVQRLISTFERLKHLSELSYGQNLVYGEGSNLHSLFCLCLTTQNRGHIADPFFVNQ